MKKKRKLQKTNKPNAPDQNVLLIDQSALDQEWMDQPRYMGLFTQQLADAREEYETAKSNFELVCAELSLAIRNDPDSYELPKVTEEVIKSAVVLQDEYQEAHKDVIEKKHQLDLLQGMVNSLDHKKKALEKLVDLFGMDFFSVPKTDKKSSREMEDRAAKRKTREYADRKKKG